jgi:hypothetical protein
MTRARKVRKKRRQGVLFIPVFVEDNPYPHWRPVVCGPRFLMPDARAEEVAIRVMGPGQTLTRIEPPVHPV